jgi:hypothetical protein
MSARDVELTYRLKADSSQGVAEMGKFRGAVKSEVQDIAQDFAAGAGRVGAFTASLGPAGLALGAVAGVAVGVAAGIGVATVRAVELGSRFNDLSLQTGLNVETLSGLSGQLIESGTNAEALGNAVLFMHKNLGQAAEGNKELKATFAELGITDVDAALRDTDGTLRKVIKSLGELTDEGDRDRLGMEALGRGYKELRVFIADTGGDIEETLRKAREAGVIMSGEVAGNLDALGDAWDRTSNKALVMSANFIGIVAPEITKGLDDIGAALSANVSDWEQWALGAAVSAGRVRGAIRGMAEWWQGDTWSPWALGKQVELGADAGELGAMTDFVLNKINPPKPKDRREGGGVPRRGGGGKKAGRDKAAEAERKEIEGELRDEAELHRTHTEELKRAYSRRIYDLAEYVQQTLEGLETHYQIQKQNFDLEEALIKRTVKGKAEQDEKLADLQRKRNASLREFERARQAVEDEQADKQRAAAEAMADARLKIDEAVARRRIAAVEAVADLGIKKESDAAAEIGNIQLDLFDKQTARLRARLVQEEEGSAAYKRIQGEIGAAEVERAALSEAVAHRVKMAKRAEVEAERQRLEQLRKLRAQAASEGIEVERLEIEVGTGSNKRPTREDRVATIRALANNERKAEEERHKQAEDAIEKLYADNQRRAKTEAERVEALKAYHAQIENEGRRHRAEMQRIDQGEKDATGEEDPLKALKDLWGDFKDQSEHAGDSIGNSVAAMSQTVVGSLYAMEGALKSGIAANILYGDSIGLAFKKALASQLAEISAEATVQGMKHSAYALGSLAFGDFGSAAKHGIAAAAFFGLAAITGKAGSSLAKSAGMRGGGASAGKAVASTGGDEQRDTSKQDRFTRDSRFSGERQDVQGRGLVGSVLAPFMSRLEAMEREREQRDHERTAILYRGQLQVAAALAPFETASPDDVVRKGLSSNLMIEKLDRAIDSDVAGIREALRKARV